MKAYRTTPAHRAHTKRWYRKNRKRALDYAAAYRETHREQLRIQERERKAACDPKPTQLRLLVVFSVEHRRRLTEANLRRYEKPEEHDKSRRRVANPEVIGACFYCGGPATEQDHRIPRRRGGTDAPENLVPACRTCNASKGALTAEEFALSRGGILAARKKAAA